MQNNEKLQTLGYLNEKGEFGPDIRLYYKRFGLDEHGVATLGTASICVMRYNSDHGRIVSGGASVYVRGIAFCSPEDQFVKSKGRAAAIGRAMKAMSEVILSQCR